MKKGKNEKKKKKSYRRVEAKKPLSICNRKG